jgi:hypothetical protein
LKIWDTTVAKQSDALKALQEARKQAMARAAQEAADTPPPPNDDLDEAECFVRLVVAMYASKLKVGMGVLPDGMAVYLRLTMPSESTDERAGMVSFVVSDDTLSVLRKAVQALESAPKPPYWKPDQFARAKP